MAKKKLSLGEKIALAASGDQGDDWPEDIEYETAAKVAEVDEDYDKLKPVGRSKLRAQNAQLLDDLDERYSGEKVSRKRLDKENGGVQKKRISVSSEEELDDDLKHEDSGSGDEEEEDGSNDEKDSQDEEQSDVEEEEEDGEEDESEEGTMDNHFQEDSEVEEVKGVRTLSIRDKQAEMEKGKAVLNQIRIWDSLLEVRIRLQKMLLDCNRLPQTTMYDELISDITSSNTVPNLTEVIDKSETATKTLMLELLRLQEIMTAQNKETKKAVIKGQALKNDDDGDDVKAGMDEEVTSNEDEEEIDQSPRKRKSNPAADIQKAKKMKLDEFMSISEQSFRSMIPFRNQTIQKWNDKTQFAGGKFNKKSASQQISTLRQIEQILGNKDRLIKRTQVKRSKYTVIGEPPADISPEEEQPLNEEIFDDDDFYHQLLRELIERKTSNVNDPTQLSRHWLELQKLRTKLKRKVDTKASKGRKIRYDVHSKLVNYMAPQDNCTMSEAAVKELFGSLFGKTKE